MPCAADGQKCDSAAINPRVIIKPLAEVDAAGDSHLVVDDGAQGGQTATSGGMGGGIPWIAWGPYLWADGISPSRDAVTWACSDLSASDGTHPSTSGQRKVADMLLTFFQTDSTARAWYLAR